MKKIFTNLIPIATYWLTFSLIFLIIFMADSSVNMIIPFSICLVIENAVVGYYVNVKKMKWGISLFAVQLLACGITYSLRVSYNNFLCFGNLPIGWVVGKYGDIKAPVFVVILTIIASLVLFVGSFFVGTLVAKKR